MSMKYEEKMLIEMCKDCFDYSTIKYPLIDWRNLLVQSTIHKVLGKLYPFFANDNNVPKWFRVLLKNTYYWQKESGTVKLREFSKIITEIQKTGIDAIVLKGCFLVPCLYRDLGIRGFSDLDILVEEENVQRICEILHDMGYVQGEYNEKEDRIILCPKSVIDERSSQLQHESEFVKVDRSHAVPIVFYIEVHHRLETVFDHTHLDTKRLFENRVPFKLVNSTASRLSNEDMLVHLCYHNYWHTQSLQDVYERRDIMLRNYMDIRLFIKEMEVCWKEILRLKSDVNLWETISYSLYFCHQIFGDVLPENILAELDQTHIEVQEKKIYDRWIVKKGKRRPLGEYNVSFLDRVFALNRFDLAVSCCDFSEYSKEAVEEYFYFFLHSAKIYNMGLTDESQSE